MRRVHFITGRKNVHREDIFACGRSQQMFPLLATTDLAKVTCRACANRLTS